MRRRIRLWSWRRSGAIMFCEHGSECFRVTYNPQYREGINKDRLSALRAQYPEIYDEFVDQTELRIFKVVKTAIA